MTAVYLDTYGHEVPQAQPTALAAGAVSTTTAGTIAGTTSAGAAPTVAVPTGFTCTDRAGTFELTAVTGGGAQAAGAVATVRFKQEYEATPTVVVNGYNVTDGSSAIVFAPSSVTKAGFDVMVGTALTTAKAYRISYHVVPTIS
jgi:hypothetical protein